MKIADALASAKYVVDADGNKTDVVIPLDGSASCMKDTASLLFARR